MSTLATFGVSKDHARERAGLLSGGAAVGRLSGLGIGRLPEGGTRKVCPGTVVEFPYATEEGPGFINALFPNGTKAVDMVVHAGPEDLIVIVGGVVIGRVSGCGIGVFRVGSCVIQPLLGGNPIVITATEYPYPPGLIRTYCVGLDQWGEYSTGVGSYTQLIQANSVACGWLPPIPGLTLEVVPQEQQPEYIPSWFHRLDGDRIQGFGNARWKVRVPGAQTTYPVTVQIAFVPYFKDDDQFSHVVTTETYSINVGNVAQDIEIPIHDFESRAVRFSDLRHPDAFGARDLPNEVCRPKYRITVTSGGLSVSKEFTVTINHFAVRYVWEALANCCEVLFRGSNIWEYVYGARKPEYGQQYERYDTVEIYCTSISPRTSIGVRLMDYMGYDIALPGVDSQNRTIINISYPGGNVRTLVATFTVPYVRLFR